MGFEIAPQGGATTVGQPESRGGWGKSEFLLAEDLVPGANSPLLQWMPALIKNFYTIYFDHISFPLTTPFRPSPPAYLPSFMFFLQSSFCVD